MSKTLLAIDATIALLEYMHRRNLNIMQFNAELEKMRSEGRKTFTIEELQEAQDELKRDIDNF